MGDIEASSGKVGHLYNKRNIFCYRSVGLAETRAEILWMEGKRSAELLPSRKEPVEAEILSDNRCSRKRGKKLLLKWQ